MLSEQILLIFSLVVPITRRIWLFFCWEVDVCRDHLHSAAFSAQEKFPLLSLGPGENIQQFPHKPPNCCTDRLENEENRIILIFLKYLPSFIRKELELVSLVSSWLNEFIKFPFLISYKNSLELTRSKNLLSLVGCF